MILAIMEDNKVMCPKTGTAVRHDNTCCANSHDENYDGYYDCSYFDGFQAAGDKWMFCCWPESDTAERERKDNDVG